MRSRSRRGGDPWVPGLSGLEQARPTTRSSDRRCDRLGASSRPSRLLVSWRRQLHGAERQVVPPDHRVHLALAARTRHELVQAAGEMDLDGAGRRPGWTLAPRRSARCAGMTDVRPPELEHRRDLGVSWLGSAPL